MLLKLFIAIFLLGLGDLYLLMKAVSTFNPLGTLLLCIGTAALGSYLAKREGLAVLNSFRQQLGQGQLPADKMIDGVMILIGATMLMTPGFLTDFLGFFLILPFTRIFLKPFLLIWAKAKLNLQMGPMSNFSAPRQASQEEKEAEVIDVE